MVRNCCVHNIECDSMRFSNAISAPQTHTYTQMQNTKREILQLTPKIKEEKEKAAFG